MPRITFGGGTYISGKLYQGFCLNSFFFICKLFINILFIKLKSCVTFCCRSNFVFIFAQILSVSNHNGQSVSYGKHDLGDFIHDWLFVSLFRHRVFQKQMINFPFAMRKEKNKSDWRFWCYRMSCWDMKSLLFTFMYYLFNEKLNIIHT